MRADAIKWELLWADAVRWELLWVDVKGRIMIKLTSTHNIILKLTILVGGNVTGGILGLRSQYSSMT